MNTAVNSFFLVILKANCTVCESDVSGATALSSPAASSDLYGTETIGSYGKIRSLKAVSFEHLNRKISLYALFPLLLFF
jgi:hypothetical protein